eukprot:TRINITY_DN109717_c0_g1_i1.p1 TRINITY_DN109717_c0_g1~~TRINITY_DN109717_c0_g1_i1.p1  ORF type:complete len:454 (-),score=68.32 TRINITY_DN109717_c0_g1_i1:258-1586(-)
MLTSILLNLFFLCASHDSSHLAKGSALSSSYGHSLLTHFHLAKGYTNLNHGSFGAPPKVVLEQEHAWQLKMVQNPDHWFRYDGVGTLNGELDVVRNRLAKYINAASGTDIVFVDNASGGMNAVIRSIRLPSDSSILYLNTVYQMVKETIMYVHTHNNQERPYQVNITIPSSNHDIVERLAAALRANPSVKLASFSHITSTPAIILPVQDLVRVCHEHGVLVVIDGAHALGQIPVDVQSIGADFYVANGHKWLYSPPGSAILWVTPDKQHLIHPNIISNEGRGATEFQMQFSYTGTKDYSPFLAMGAALDFREQVLGGEEAIMSYMHELAAKGGELLASTWRTEKLVHDEFIGAMVNVRLPDAAFPCCSLNGLTATVFARYNTWVPAIEWAGKCYMRVSAQVYNELVDFKMLADSVLEVLRGGCSHNLSSAAARRENNSSVSV